jgi:hypothetical protein
MGNAQGLEYSKGASSVITHGRTERVIKGFNIVGLNPQIGLTVSGSRLEGPEMTFILIYFNQH